MKAEKGIETKRGDRGGTERWRELGWRAGPFGTHLAHLAVEGGDDVRGCELEASPHREFQARDPILKTKPQTYHTQINVLPNSERPVSCLGKALSTSFSTQQADRQRAAESRQTQSRHCFFCSPSAAPINTQF